MDIEVLIRQKLNERVIKERVLKGDYKKVYTLEEIWKWILWGLNKGIIKKNNEKDNIENIMKWIDLLGRSRFVQLENRENEV
ncbi:MAG: hypothetical protein HWE24_20610 [Oceanospirillaceae bacterium]|nr:hypothetical protein [Oceanospirillaceae bacterium]